MTHSLRGSIKFIDEYRRCHFIPEWTPDEHKTFVEIVEGTAPAPRNDQLKAKIPIYTKGETTVVRVNLSKYDKPYMKRYESLIGVPLTINVEIMPYEHEQFGNGVSIKLARYSKRITQ